METVYLFQYGSNLNTERLNSRERLNGAARYIASARLGGYKLVFDIYSRKNQCAAANVIEDPTSAVIGALYEVEKELVIASTGEMSAMDRVESAKPDGSGNYNRRKITVIIEPDKKVEAYTYIGTAAAQERFIKEDCIRTVSDDYLSHIVMGAREKGISEQYIAHIERAAGEHNAKYLFNCILAADNKIRRLPGGV